MCYKVKKNVYLGSFLNLRTCTNIDQNNKNDSHKSTSSQVKLVLFICVRYCKYGSVVFVSAKMGSGRCGRNGTIVFCRCCLFVSLILLLDTLTVTYHSIALSWEALPVNDSVSVSHF